MVNTIGKYTFLITADIHFIEIQQDSSTEYARTLFKHLYLMIVFIKYATRTLSSFVLDDCSVDRSLVGWSPTKILVRSGHTLLDWG